MWYSTASVRERARRGCKRARLHACDFLCFIDTLTSASLLPGIDSNFAELPKKNRLQRSRPHGQYVKAGEIARANHSIFT